MKKKSTEKNFFPEKACVEVLTPRTSDCEELRVEGIKEADFTYMGHIGEGYGAVS